MQTTYKARRLIVIVSTLLIIGGTSLVFQLTQSFYMSFITGEKYYEKGSYATALPHFLAAYQRDPRSMRAAGYLLWTYERLGMRKKANRMLEKIWKENPDDLKVVEQLADGLHTLSDYRKAEELYRLVLKKEENPRVSRKLAEVLIAQEKYPEAITLLRQFVAAHPKDLGAKEHLADVLSWAKQYNESIALYREIIPLDPENTEVILKTAETLRYAQRDQEAVYFYKMYLEQEE